MIYGETTHTDGTAIINVTWPQRGLFYVSGFTEAGDTVNVYVWDDCCDDAIDSTLEWMGEEGSDDSGLSVTEITRDLYTEIKAVTDVHNEKE